MKNSELEWFRPLWLRLLVTGLVAVWFVWETLLNPTKETLWMVITGFALAYAVWNLFINYKDPGRPADGTKKDGDGKPQA